MLWNAGPNAVKYAELLENNFMIMRSALPLENMQNRGETGAGSIEGASENR